MFENPNMLSLSTELDTLRITFLDELAFKQSINLVYVPILYTAYASIPP